MSNHTKTGGEALVYENRAEGMHVISPECGKAFQDMKLKRKSRYIIFKIGEEQIDVEKLGARTATFEDLKKDLPYTDSRYVVFDQEFTTHDGRQTSKLWFISWFPNNSTPYNKMAYTSGKIKFRDELKGTFDIQAANCDEIAEHMGLNEDEDDGASDDDF